MRWSSAVLGAVAVAALLGSVSAVADTSPSGSPPSTEPTTTTTAAGKAPASGQIQGNFVPAKGGTLRVHGTAKLIRGPKGGTKLSVHVAGLGRDKPYPTYLHSGACADHGADYMQDPNGPPAPPNELWASSDPSDPKGDTTSDSAGNARGYGQATWTARPDARSVVITSHDDGNPVVACADLG